MKGTAMASLRYKSILILEMFALILGVPLNAQNPETLTTTAVTTEPELLCIETSLPG
jgi:hypothetical protein